jgi:uncharacterized protein (DUF697 family)
MSWLDKLEEIRTRDFKKATPEEREQAARDIVNTCSYATAAVSISPIPFSDALLMLPIQSGMVVAVGHVYGRKLTSAAAGDLFAELGTVAGASFLARQGIKALLPVVGALLTAPAAFAATWGMGRVAMEYFKNPGVSKDVLAEVYRNAKREGKAVFSSEKVNGAHGEVRANGTANGKSLEHLLEVELPEKLRQKPEVVEQLDAVIHLEIGGKQGGQWTMDLTQPGGRVRRGHKGRAKMTVTCEDEELLRIARGERDAQAAVLAGSLQLEPLDLELASGLRRLFS